MQRVLRVASVNVGKLESRLPSLMGWMLDERIDVLVLCETHSYASMSLCAVAKADKFTLCCVDRPVDCSVSGDGTLLYAGKVGGGVALLAAPGVSVRVENHDARGAVSAVASRRGFHNVGVIGAYLPPRTGGVGRRSRHLWRGPLSEFIVSEFNRLAAALGRESVLVAGDLNSTWGRGPLGDWASDDARVGDRNFWFWAARAGISPVHGRAGQPCLFLTSRSPASTRAAYTTAVDYVLAAAEAVAGVARGVRRFESPWYGEPQAHCPVAVDLALRPRSAPLPPPRPPPRLYFPFTFGSPEATLFGNELARALPAAVEAAADADVSASASCAALVGALSKAAVTALSDPKRCPRERVRRGVAGRPLPPAVRLICREARVARRAVGAAYRRGLPPAELDLLVAACHSRRTAARRACRRVLREQVHRSTIKLASLRTRDKHAFAVWLSRSSSRDGRSRLGPARVPTSGDVSAPDRFREYCLGLYTPAEPPPAVSPGGERWLDDVPQLPPDLVEAGWGDSCGVAWSDTDVYLAIYGTQAAPPGGLQFTPCCASCPRCADFATGLAAYDAGDAGQPPAWPAARLRTSVTPGDDGLHAELVRWFVVDEAEGGTFASRMRLCHGIAMALRKVSNDGLPPELAVSLVFPLLKAVKPGQVSDPSDPAAYRTLAVAALLAKILALLMLARLSHFAEGTGALPWEQGSARLGGQSAELHAFTLLSFLRARRRAGKWSYVLYVDVVKAFDRVHPAALDAALLRMGVPEPMRHLLRTWREGRLGAVVVNGAKSGTFPIRSGVPQGCPLSPLLFNLFLASLSRYLASCPELRGATALSLRLLRLIFADDVAIVTDSPSEIQAALSLVHEWMRAWGLDISVGPSKTEAQAFPPSAAAAALAAPLPALLTADGRSVAWVSLYRYLGLSLPSDLGVSEHMSRVVASVRGAYSRFFHRNEVVRCLPPGVQLQILRSYVLSGAEYLRGVLPLRRSDAKALDAVALDAVRGIFGFPRHTSHALLWAVSGLVPAATLALRAQLRLLLQLLSSTTDAPAERLVRALAAEPQSPSSRSGPASNWVHTAWAARARWLEIGASVPDAGAPFARAARGARAAAALDFQAGLRVAAASAAGRAAGHVADAAAALAAVARPPAARYRLAVALAVRAYELGVASHGPLRHVLALLPLGAAPAAVPYVRPPCVGSAAHTAWLCARPVDDEDAAADGSPLSLMGPGCASVLNSVTAASRRFHALYAALLGGEALAMFPFAEGVRCPPADRPAAPHRRAAQSDFATDFGMRFVPRMCRLCGTAPECIHHLAFDCPHTSLCDERVATAEEARVLVADIRKAVVDARSRRGAVWAPPDGPEDDALTAFLSGVPLGDDELAFLGYRLLLAAPFPADVARRHGFRAAAAVGFLLGSVRAQDVRPLCEAWAAWAEQRLRRIAAAWQMALAIDQRRR